MDSKYPRVVSHQQRSLAAIRIFIGLWFLYAVSMKMSPGWVGGFDKLMSTTVASHPPALYGDFLRETVIPNASFFAIMVIMGELAVGICLVLGMFTAPACMLGSFLNLNFMLAFGSQDVAAVGMNLVFIVIQFALAFGHAGTTWGLDRSMMDRMPWWCQGLMHYEYREF